MAKSWQHHSHRDSAKLAGGGRKTIRHIRSMCFWRVGNTILQASKNVNLMCVPTLPRFALMTSEEAGRQRRFDTRA